MKKTTRFIGTMLLAITLLLSCFSPICVQAAQKVKLSKSKITITEGNQTSLYLMLDGIQLIDDGHLVKWSSSNKNIATVNKYGNIKGISKGTATISAKYNKKSYKCKVTIKPAFNAKEAEKNITFTPVETADNLYEVTSTYDFPTLVTITFKTIDSEGITIDQNIRRAYVTCWGKSYVTIPPNSNENVVKVTYKYSDFSERINKEQYDNINNSLQLYKFDRQGAVLNVYIKNTSDKKIKRVSLGVLLCDENGEVFGISDTCASIENIEAGEIVKTDVLILNHNYTHELGDIKLYIASF